MYRQSTGSLVVSKEDYVYVLRQMRRIHSAEKNNERYERLASFCVSTTRMHMRQFPQFPERLCKCPGNRRVCFGEEPSRICGMSNRVEIVNPDKEDVERALYILRKYRKLNE